MPTMNIESEVTGTIWKVEVKAGQSVSEDETLLIVESMKMEIPVTAPKAGRVAEVKVMEGDAVTDQQVLVVLETAA
ncbi:MAG: yngHB [Burkholderia sp.]|jgi:acetyl-CoA carboxylase biotin carboxyl carrier protein|nr:yngHB [Burkholderia sp.]